MREPFYWPMNAPPLPEPYPANEVGKDWEFLHDLEAVANDFRVALGVFAQRFEMDPTEVEQAAHHEWLIQRFGRMYQ